MIIKTFKTEDEKEMNKYIAEHFYEIPENGVMFFESCVKVIANPKQIQSKLVAALTDWYTKTYASKIALQNEKRHCMATQIKNPKAQVAKNAGNNQTVLVNVESRLREINAELNNIDEQLHYAGESIQDIKSGKIDKDLLA
jgi:hypothetical protein